MTTLPLPARCAILLALLATLLLAEHDNTALDPQTARALTAALAIDPTVDIVVAGKNCTSVAAAAARLAGVRRVLLAAAGPLANQLAEPVAALIVRLAEDYETLVTAATSQGKNVMPRVAALLDVMQVSDIIAVVASDTFRRPTYAGNAVETVLVLRQAAPQLIASRFFPLNATRSGWPARWPGPRRWRGSRFSSGRRESRRPCYFPWRSARRCQSEIWRSASSLVMP